MAASKTARTKPKRIVKRPEGTSQININLPSPLLEALDEWLEKLNASPEGARWTRTDILRTLLSQAIEKYAEKGESP